MSWSLYTLVFCLTYPSHNIVYIFCFFFTYVDFFLISKKFTIFNLKVLLPHPFYSFCKCSTFSPRSGEPLNINEIILTIITQTSLLFRNTSYKDLCPLSIIRDWTGHYCLPIQHFNLFSLFEKLIIVWAMLEKGSYLPQQRCEKEKITLNAGSRGQSCDLISINHIQGENLESEVIDPKKHRKLTMLSKSWWQWPSGMTPFPGLAVLVVVQSQRYSAEFFCCIKLPLYETASYSLISSQTNPWWSVTFSIFSYAF